jgi:hypothetical protein
MFLLQGALLESTELKISYPFIIIRIIFELLHDRKIATIIMDSVWERRILERKKVLSAFTDSNTPFISSHPTR